MNDLLCYCVEHSGYDLNTVKTIIDCFLGAIKEKSSAGCEVVSSKDLGVFISKTHSEGEPGTYNVLFQKSYEPSCPSKTDSPARNIERSSAFEGLLETLSVQVGCMYLSDLHLPSNLPLIRHALRKISPESFSVREWNDAVCYITHQKVCFASQQEAFHYLMNFS